MAQRSLHLQHCIEPCASNYSLSECSAVYTRVLFNQGEAVYMRFRYCDDMDIDNFDCNMNAIGIIVHGNIYATVES